MGSVSINDLSIIYHHKSAFFEVDEEKIDSVFVTAEGLLLEVFSEKVVSSCTLSSHLRSCTSFDIYYLYYPYTKYYIVFADEQLFIVEKVDTNELKLKQTFKNVSQVSVDCAYNAGQQCVSYIDGVGKKCIVDFYAHSMDTESETRKSKVFENSALLLITEIQMLDERLNNAKKVLEKKKAFVRLKQSPLDESIEALNEQSFPPINIFDDGLLPPSVLQGEEITHGRPWLRICGELWVIGVKVYNDGEKSLRNVTLRAHDSLCEGETHRIESTKIYMVPTSPESASEIQTTFEIVKAIEKRSSAYVIGLMAVPVFINDRIKLSLIIFCTPNNHKDQRYIGEIEVDCDDLFSSNFSVFRNEEPLAEDILAVVATTKNVRIPLAVLDSNGLPRFKSGLLKLGFKDLNDFYYVYDPESSEFMSGTMLYINFENENELLIILYFRSHLQLSAFLKKVKGYLSSFCSLNVRSLENVSSELRSLKEEVNMCSRLLEKASEDAVGRIQVDFKFRKTILGLERKMCVLLTKHFFTDHDMDDE